MIIMTMIIIISVIITVASEANSAGHILDGLPVVSLESKQMLTFVWRYVVCWF